MTLQELAENYISDMPYSQTGMYTHIEIQKIERTSFLKGLEVGMEMLEFMKKTYYIGKGPQSIEVLEEFLKKKYESRTDG
jgi:hypothetical protein